MKLIKKINYTDFQNGDCYTNLKHDEKKFALPSLFTNPFCFTNSAIKKTVLENKTRLCNS